MIRFASADTMRRWKDAINAAARGGSGSISAAAAATAYDTALREERRLNKEESIVKKKSSGNGGGGGGGDDGAGEDGAAAATSMIKITATLSELSVVVAAPLDPSAVPSRTTTAAAATAAVPSSGIGDEEDGDEFFDASEEDEWWTAGGGGGGGAVTKSQSQSSLNGSGGVGASPPSPPEQVLVRLVLSRVSAAVVKSAVETEVSVGLAGFTVHDSYATAALGKPCHLLTSGAASCPVAGRPSNDGVFHVAYRAWDPGSSHYTGVDSEITAVLGPLSMAVRRPTIAALAALPAAIKAAKGEGGGAAEEDTHGGGGGGGAGSGGGGGSSMSDSYGGGGEITAVETGKNRQGPSYSQPPQLTRLNSSVLPFSTNEQHVFPSFKPQVERKRVVSCEWTALRIGWRCPFLRELTP